MNNDFVNEIVGGDGKRRYRITTEGDGRSTIIPDYVPEQPGSKWGAQQANEVAEHMNDVSEHFTGTEKADLMGKFEGAKAKQAIKADNGTYTLTHSKSGTVHTLTGLPATSGLYSCQFIASAPFNEGNTFAGGYTAKPMGEETTLPDKAFVAGDLVTLVANTGAKKLGFKLGGGSLKWNVYTGLTAPTPKENGVWAEIAEPVKNCKVVFDMKRPVAPQEKTLFFQYYPREIYPLTKPISGQDGITYRVMSAQYFVGGKWQNINAYQVVSGQWQKFSQGEYYLYIRPSTNKLRKIDRNGLMQWEYVSPVDISDMCIDWVNRWAYVTHLISSTSVYIVKLDINTGTPLDRYPTTDGYVLLGVTNCRIVLMPSLSQIVIGSKTNGNPPVNNTGGIIDLTTKELTRFGREVNDPNITPEGIVYAKSYNASYNISAQVYPSFVSLVGKPNSSTPINYMRADRTGFYAMNYDNGGAYTLFGKLGTTEEQVFPTGFSGLSYTPDFIRLLNGDVAFAAYGFGLAFFQCNSNGYPIATTGKYKTITLNGIGASRVVITPSGEIFAVDKISHLVYRVNPDDTVTQIGVTTGQSDYRRFLYCEPCAEVTFPEHWQAENQKKTVFLAHFQDDIADVSDARMPIINYGCSLSTEKAKFGSKSLKIDLTQYLEMVDTSTLRFAGDFTVECWAYMFGNAGFTFEIGKYTANGILHENNYWYHPINTSVGDFTEPSGEWVHMCIERYNGTVYAFINGVLKKAVPSTDNMGTQDVNNVFRIGKTNYNVTATPPQSQAYVQEFRISRVSRYKGTSFSPPATPFVND